MWEQQIITVFGDGQPPGLRRFSHCFYELFIRAVVADAEPPDNVVDLDFERDEQLPRPYPKFYRMFFIKLLTDFIERRLGVLHGLGFGGKVFIHPKETELYQFLLPAH